MSLPTAVRTWKQLVGTVPTPGLQIPFVSLADTMSNLLFNIKDFAVNSSGATTKFSLVWTSAGGTGPTNSSDHTDRWTSAAVVTPRGASAGVSQAWVVLSDGNARPAWANTHAYSIGDYITNSGNVYVCKTAGTSSSAPTGTGADIVDGTVHWTYVGPGTGAAQWLFAWQGSTDDVCRISFSPGALFTLAGTTNQQPTATDERILTSTPTVIGSTASADRILHMLVSDDAKAWRFALFRSSALVGQICGGENFDASSLASPAFMQAPVWGFCYSATNSRMNGGTTGFYGAPSIGDTGGICSVTYASTLMSIRCGAAYEAFNGTAVTDIDTFTPELQGGSAYVPQPIGLRAATGATARGRLGNLYDLWTCSPSGVVQGDGLGTGTDYRWMQLGVWLWPNPSGVVGRYA